jgi:hypothetical protein
MPSGDYLERCIIALVDRPYVSDPDDTRFRVTISALLGRDYASIIGAESFTDTITALFAPIRSDPITVIRNRTGLGETVVRGLLNYRPTGKIPFSTMVLIVRAFLRRRHKNAGLDERGPRTIAELKRFDDLAVKFTQQVKAGAITIEPMQLQELQAQAEELIPEREPPPPPPKTDKPQMQKQEGQDPHAIRAAAAALLAARTALDGQLQALVLQFPDVLGTVVVPQPSVQTPTEQVTPSGPTADRLKELVLTQGPMTGLEVTLTSTFFRQMILLSERICDLSEEQRLTLLRELDPLLVRLSRLIQATGLKEPAAYLRMLEESGSAGALLGVKR